MKSALLGRKTAIGSLLALKITPAWALSVAAIAFVYVVARRMRGGAPDEPLDVVD